MIHGISNDYLYAVSKITIIFSNGIDRKNWQGTGFFIKKDTDLFFITNRHIIQPALYKHEFKDYTEYERMTIDYRSFNKESKSVEVNVIEVSTFHPVYPSQVEDDIACLLVKVKEYSGQVPGYIDYSMLATSTQIEDDLCVCDNLVFIGFPSVYDHRNNLPILRSGVISSDPRVNYSYDDAYRGHIIAYESFSTPGASGSPVFATQKGFQVGGMLSASDDFYRPVRLIGIMAGNLVEGQVNQQMSYIYKSDVIISLIEKAVSMKNLL